MAYAAADKVEASGVHLIFKLGDTEFGLRVRYVHEIIGHLPTTPLPGGPRHMTGMINLRGKVVPVISMHSRLQIEDKRTFDVEQTNTKTVYIVVEGPNKEPVGLAVDSVSDVTHIDNGACEAPPACGMAVENQFISSIAKIGQRLFILLNLEQILSDT